VLAARISSLELVDARRIVSARDRAYFKDLGDAMQRLREVNRASPIPGLAVATRYFSVEGTVSYGPARLAARALVRRDPGRLEVLWTEETGEDAAPAPLPARRPRRDSALDFEVLDEQRGSSSAARPRWAICRAFPRRAHHRGA